MGCLEYTTKVEVSVVMYAVNHGHSGNRREMTNLLCRVVVLENNFANLVDCKSNRCSQLLPQYESHHTNASMLQHIAPPNPLIY